MFHLQTQTILSKLTSQILVGVVYYFITSQQVICSCLSHMFNCLVVYYFIISHQVICSCLSHMLSCPEVILCGLQDVKIQLSYILLTTDRHTHTSLEATQEPVTLSFIKANAFDQVCLIVLMWSCMVYKTLKSSCKLLCKLRATDKHTQVSMLQKCQQHSHQSKCS